jgi:N-acetylglucosamine-6-phosphate deacetylase
MGHDVSDASPEAIQTVSRFLAEHGTTAFLAAAVYDPAALQTLHDVTRDGAEGAALLGVYLEGPFINPAKRGGVPAAAIRPPSERLLTEILQSYEGSLRMMTVAPEMPGALPLIPILRRAGVIPALGHSDAPLAVALEAERHGARHLTHLFNAMSGLHHREPGLAALVAASDDVTAEITADGVHVHPTMLRLAMRLAGHPPRLALITDCVRPTGLPDGDYAHLGRPMRLTGTRAALLDGTLVGSVITLRQAIVNAVRDGDAPLADAVYMSTLLPATILGIQREYGHLDAGARADLLLLDREFAVASVYVAGTLRYGR